MILEEKNENLLRIRDSESKHLSRESKKNENGTCEELNPLIFPKGKNLSLYSVLGVVLNRTDLM